MYAKLNSCQVIIIELSLGSPEEKHGEKCFVTRSDGNGHETKFLAENGNGEAAKLTST